MNIRPARSSVGFVEWLGNAWNRFWLEPSEAVHLTRARLCLCAAAMLWLLLNASDSSWWFGPNGWNNDRLARELSVASEGEWPSRFRVTPLWSAAHPWTFQAWAGTGVALAIVAALGFGGRITMAALMLCVLFAVQRTAWTSDAFEPLLVAGLGYLIINPGRPLFAYSRKRQANLGIENETWSANLATRLIQVHVWLLLAFGLASLIATMAWWRGEALWWLAASEHSTLLSSAMLRGRVMLGNALTHAIVFSAIAAVFTLWHPHLRRIGLIGGCVLGLSYAFFSDQVLYGLLIVSLLLSVFTRPILDRPASAGSSATS